MDEHTWEPWTWTSHAWTIAKDEKIGTNIPVLLGGDWERAMECVNACANIPNPEQAIPKLVEALEELLAWEGGWEGDMFNKAREALAMMKGSK